jgi:hypothetical protein
LYILFETFQEQFELIGGRYFIIAIAFFVYPDDANDIGGMMNSFFR